MLAGNKPNILMIVADQHRYDCLGGSRSYPVTTPNIDRLKSEGMTFENAYTVLPACCPARQSMLRGRRPESFGALWNFNNGLKTGALSVDDYTWTKDLKENGYKTCHIGKWQESPSYGPEFFGYDICISEKEYNIFRNEKYPDSKCRHGWMGGTDDVPVADSRTHYLAGRAVNVIQEYVKQDSPWLIRLNYSEPHLPCTPSEEFASLYKSDIIPFRKSFNEQFVNKPYIQKQQLKSWGIENLTWNDWAAYAANYCAMVSQVDDAAGKVLDSLAETGADRKTIVIYTSDHGDMGGSHRMIDKHYVMYDDVVRVPFIVKWPGVVKPGTSCSEFISNCLDLAPTILSMAGLPDKVEGFFHGKSMESLLKNNTDSNWRKEIVCTYNGQQFGLFTQRMIRDNKWKYVWNTTDIDELYDIEKDPDELINLIYEADLSNILSKLRIRLFEVLSGDGDELVGSEWMKRQLVEGCKH